MPYANQLWQADTMFGPQVAGKQTKLIAFIDDASRVLCHGEFFLDENSDSMIRALPSAFYKRGLPEQLLVDNGSIYCSQEITLICARVGCILRHTAVRDAAAKGKIERFFRRARDQFLIRNLDLSSIQVLNRQCERKLIQQAFNLNRSGKMLVTIIDDAHLMEMENLRKLRLLLEDFPKNHNLILIGQVELLSSLDLGVNQDIKSRVTYSVVTRRLPDDLMREFIHRELDRLGLAHSTFTSGAVELILRSSDGVLRRCRNLCLSSMLEAVRAAAGRSIDIDVVNRVLLQPHWQNPVDLTDF